MHNEVSLYSENLECIPPPPPPPPKKKKKKKKRIRRKSQETFDLVFIILLTFTTISRQIPHRTTNCCFLFLFFSQNKGSDISCKFSYYRFCLFLRKIRKQYFKCRLRKVLPSMLRVPTKCDSNNCLITHLEKISGTLKHNISFSFFLIAFIA